MDEITFKKAADAVDAPTASAILGPFFRHDAPVLENESSIIQTAVDDGEIVYMHGTVTDHTTKKPIVGATVDAWQASTNGLYEQQDDEQAEHNLRGKFKTDENGHYGFYCLKPTPYPVPFDGMSFIIFEEVKLIISRSRWQNPTIIRQTSIPTCTYPSNCKF